MILNQQHNGIKKLDALKEKISYIPINTGIMLSAANMWALARKKGKPTAHDKSIDIDVILAAQSKSVKENEAIIATTNIGHLSLFATAEKWENIKP